MPALDVHHPKTFEPAFEHVYVTVPPEIILDRPF